MQQEKYANAPRISFKLIRQKAYISNWFLSEKWVEIITTQSTLTLNLRKYLISNWVYLVKKIV